MRRWWWILFGLALAVVGPLARAQQPKKIPHLGYLAAVSASADAPRLEAFRRGLRDLGYVEGQSILIDYRHESQDLQRLSGLADELVRLDIDVLVAVTTNAAQAASKATKTVPIVFMGVTDPIATGLAESLARPGGNSTGITNVAAILTGKRLEILKETVTGITRVAVLWDPRAPGSVPQWEASQVPGASGSHSTATRLTAGRTSFRSSSRLPVRIAATLVMPVAFPPGRARLSASPVAMGSVTPMKTIGTVRVVRVAACAAFDVTVTSTSMSRAISSAARLGSRCRSWLSWR